jgi:hypothetical protein
VAACWTKTSIALCWHGAPDTLVDKRFASSIDMNSLFNRYDVCSRTVWLPWRICGERTGLGQVSAPALVRNVVLVLWWHGACSGSAWTPSSASQH